MTKVPLLPTKWLALPLCLMACGWIGCRCEPELIGSVPNNLRPQETNNWCWAAVTEMLAEEYGLAVDQCDLSNTALGRTDCCDPAMAGTTCPKDPDCNQPGWPMLTEAGLDYSESAAALSWADVREEIYCGKDPMGFAYGTPGVVGHVVVIKGYFTVGGIDYVVLNDPWAPCSGQERVITYDEYVDPAGTATHWNTWYNLRKS